MVIPVHDINPVRRAVWVTYALIAFNVIVFLLTPGASTSLAGSVPLSTQCRQEAFYDRYGAIPDELTHNRQEPIAATGHVGSDGLQVGCTTGPPRYHKVAFWSAITAQFVHGGWLHLLGNMLFLGIFGNNVEDRMGSAKYLLFYLVSGLVAAYGFALAHPDSTETLIGASGAIAGVLGAYLVMFPKAKVWSLVPVIFFIPLKLPAWFVLGLWFVLQWVYANGTAVSSAGSVAYLAHVVGFLFGMLVGLVVNRLPPPRSPAGYATHHPRTSW